MEIFNVGYFNWQNANHANISAKISYLMDKNGLHIYLKNVKTLDQYHAYYVGNVKMTCSTVAYFIKKGYYCLTINNQQLNLAFKDGVYMVNIDMHLIGIHFNIVN